MTAAADIEVTWLPLTYAEQRSFNEVYGFAGSQGMVHLEALLMRPRGRPSKTLFIFMHPATSMDVLPVPRSLAALGCHVLCARNRYFQERLGADLREGPARLRRMGSLREAAARL